MTASPVRAGLASILSAVVLALIPTGSNAQTQLSPPTMGAGDAAPLAQQGTETGTTRRPRALVPQAPGASPQAEPAPAPAGRTRPGTWGVRPRATTGTPSSSPQRPSFRTTRGGIRTEQLGGVNPDAVGALTVAQGGFGPTMWSGTKRPLIDLLLPQLPVRTASPTMRDLMRRLLLSTAVPPEGQAVPGSLIGQRIRLLSDMGELEGTAALLAAVPSRARSPELIRLGTDLLLLSGESARACAVTANQIRQTDTPYWQKMLIFCQMLAGDREKAMLGASLMQEMGEDDRAFFSLVDMLALGESQPLESLPDPTPLHLAMAKAAQAPLPSDMVKSARPAVLRTMALNVTLPVELRVLAGEKAEATGALPVRVLRELYGAVPFTEVELANPLTLAEGGTLPETEPVPSDVPDAAPMPDATPVDEGMSAEESGEAALPPPPLDPDMKGRVILFQTASAQTVSSAQAEAAAAALVRSREDGIRRYTSAVRVLLPVLESLEPSVKLMWLAPEMVRALLSAGQVERAGAWFRLLASNGAFNPESAKAAALLKPAMRLAGATEAQDWSPKDLARWWEAMMDRNPEDARDRGAMLFAVMEGIEEFVPEGLWDRLAEGQPTVPGFMPHTALWHRLGVASKRGNLGETILLSLVFMGEDGPEGSHPLVMEKVLGALRATGLEAEARALSVEAVGAGASRS